MCSHNPKPIAYTHTWGPRPTSLAYSRVFFSKQEAVDSFPWYFQNTLITKKKKNKNRKMPNFCFKLWGSFPLCPLLLMKNTANWIETESPRILGWFRIRVASGGKREERKKKIPQVSNSALALLEFESPRTRRRGRGFVARRGDTLAGAATDPVTLASVEQDEPLV